MTEEDFKKFFGVPPLYRRKFIIEVGELKVDSVRPPQQHLKRNITFRILNEEVTITMIDPVKKMKIKDEELRKVRLKND